MEIPTHQEEGEMPIPLNSTYAHAHIIHHHDHNHNHIIPSSTPPSNGPQPLDTHLPNPTIIIKPRPRYRECLKNHAASMGGNATDGCGEFMPAGEDGTLEALTCSACACHRNFHRKETEQDDVVDEQPLHHFSYPPRKLFHVSHHKGYFGHSVSRARAPHPPPPQHMIMSTYNISSLRSDSEEEGGNAVARPVKKRFRTKFTQEQKEKMMGFAERVGWKIQKQEEAVVQQFCQEVGVKRRVLKVWMHNNKHSLAKKSVVDTGTNHHQPASSVNPPQSQV